MAKPIEEVISELECLGSSGSINTATKALISAYRDMETALAEADRKNAALLDEWNKAEQRNTELTDALERIAESHDAGRHDGLPEPCPAHDDILMWSIARATLSKQSDNEGDV